MSKSLISKINSNIQKMELGGASKKVSLGVDSYKQKLLMLFDQTLEENLREVDAFSPFDITIPDTKGDIHDLKVAAKELGFVIIDHFSCEPEAGYEISVARNRGCSDDNISIAQKRLLKYKADLLERKNNIRSEIASVCATLRSMMETGNFTFKETFSLSYEPKIDWYVNTCSTDVFIKLEYHPLINFEKHIVASFFRRHDIAFIEYSSFIWHFKL